ncbi:unnamed protein product [Closterium sp. Naga37s-1]|nr:unnamed protein product [Closterium sp. Naga37s-1]
MARGLSQLLLLLLVTATWRTSPLQGAEAKGLSRAYYKDSCPYLETIVREIVIDEYDLPDFLPRFSPDRLHLALTASFSPRLAYGPQGCDGSVLLNSTPGNKAEKDAPPNLSLNGFNIIDRIKTAVEAKCPGVVSCADIAALAARDGVSLAGGPYIKTQLGRRDSRTSKAALAVKFLPGHQMDVNALLSNFAAINLTLVDLVTLSGGHTIGESHCDTVAHRIAPNRDPTIARSMRKYLEGHCKAPKVDGTIPVVLDIRTSKRFDNQYFKNLQRKFGLLTSDQVLAIDPRTKDIVNEFAADKKSFFRHFRRSMSRVAAAEERVPGRHARAAQKTTAAADAAAVLTAADSGQPGPTTQKRQRAAPSADVTPVNTPPPPFDYTAAAGITLDIAAACTINYSYIDGRRFCFC